MVETLKIGIKNVCFYKLLENEFDCYRTRTKTTGWIVRSLFKAANASEVWFITNGFDAGIPQLIGSAFRDELVRYQIILNVGVLFFDDSMIFVK